MSAPPNETRAIGSKRLFSIKRDSQNNITKYKERLEALGCHLNPGTNYEELHASILGKTSLQILLGVVNQVILKLHQMDVKRAFLNAQLEEEVYLKPPHGLYI